MPGDLTAITEIVTALGMLAPNLASGLEQMPSELRNVPDETWERLVENSKDPLHTASFATSFANGQAFLMAEDGLRGRRPLLVEWRGPHRPPGDDVIPADLRIDRVFLVSCKYLSRILFNPGPARLFDRLLIGEDRSPANWFAVTAPREFQELYAATRSHLGLDALPTAVGDLSRDDQRLLKSVLSSRSWPHELESPWGELCAVVAAASADRWAHAAGSDKDRLRLLWRMLRISTATYFVLGAAKGAHLRLRVDSNWDWMQDYQLRSFDVRARAAGQPEVAWNAVVTRRADGVEVPVDGHVEIRWSHGRFLGSPEAKVYLDTPHDAVPGYQRLAHTVPSQLF